MSFVLVSEAGANKARNTWTESPSTTLQAGLDQDPPCWLHFNISTHLKALFFPKCIF